MGAGKQGRLSPGTCALSPQLSAEVFPAETRTTGHGIAAAFGKIGGFIGVFTFAPLMKWKGAPGAESVAAIVSLLGIVTTIAFLPETKGKTLEELNEKATAAAK